MNHHVLLFFSFVAVGRLLRPRIREPTQPMVSLSFFMVLSFMGMLGKTQILKKLLIHEGGIAMKVLQYFNYVALSFLGLLLINGCGDNQMAPTEPVQVQGQATLGKKSSDFGSRLVFQSWRGSNWEICVMNADGSGQTNLTNYPGYDGAPSWSPNGKKIAFATYRDGNWDLFFMNADGSEQTRLMTDNMTDAWNPDWSLTVKSSHSWEFMITKGPTKTTRFT
jgi:TolB protein